MGETVIGLLCVLGIPVLLWPLGLLNPEGALPHNFC